MEIGREGPEATPFYHRADGLSIARQWGLDICSSRGRRFAPLTDEASVAP
jgi:hypothetical protein